MHLLINADDLGMSSTVNRAIFEELRKGRLRSATLMANGPAVNDAARLLRDFPGCSFGAHLNLTQFHPLSSSKALQPLLAPDGTFAPKAVRSLPLCGGLRHAIYVELAAQVTRLLDLGVPVSHVDSHHHVHTIPGLFGTLKALQRRFALRKVRLSMNLYEVAPTIHLRLCKALWNAALRFCPKTATTARFTSLATFAKVLPTMRKHPKSVELMCHPGGVEYAAEAELLREGFWSSLGNEHAFISYHEL